MKGASKRFHSDRLARDEPLSAAGVLEQRRQADTAFDPCAFWPAAELRDRVGTPGQPIHPRHPPTCEQSLLLPAKMSRLTSSLLFHPLRVTIRCSGHCRWRRRGYAMLVMEGRKGVRCDEDVGGSKAAEQWW